jgi:hypothetical protein
LRARVKKLGYFVAASIGAAKVADVPISKHPSMPHRICSDTCGCRRSSKFLKRGALPQI